MRLPLSPPTPPMLAKLEREIPRGDGWRYEPKWDGFRSIVYRDGDELFIESRDGRPLARYFPELVPVLSAALPDRCVVDGEIVVAVESGLDFDLLQMRLHPAASRVQKLAGETPSSFVAFDLLAEGEQDLTKEPLDSRRGRLEDALRGEAPDAAGRLQPLTSQVLLTPQTADPQEAERWFFELERLGLDGIIAKRAESPYTPGKRTMVKVKHRRTADCVVGGYRLAKSGDGVGSLLLGLFDGGGTLHFVGHTASFTAAQRRSLLSMLRPLEGEGGFGLGRAPGGPSRWTGREAAWVPLSPTLVCEVSFDHLQGDRFRHAATFLRWRDDKPPAECRFDQLEPPR